MTGLGALLLAGSLIVGGWGVTEVKQNLEEKVVDTSCYIEEYKDNELYFGRVYVTKRHEGKQDGRDVVALEYNDGSRFYFKDGKEISFYDGETGELIQFEGKLEAEHEMKKIMFLKNN